MKEGRSQEAEVLDGRVKEQKEELVTILLLTPPLMAECGMRGNCTALFESSLRKYFLKKSKEKN